MKIFEQQIDNKYSVEKHQDSKEYKYFENGKCIPESVDILYKYMPWNENTITALLKNYLWLTNPVHFNDPFDCNRNIIFNNEFSEKERFIKRNFFDEIGIISFTENRFCPLMWAHYTGNYNGIVLKFRSNNFTNFENQNQFNQIKLRKVLYPESLIRFPLGLQYSKEIMFFVKTNHWKYEKEWRLVANLKEPYNRYLRFDPDSLEEIYIGHNLFENRNYNAIQIITQIRDTYYPKTKLTRVIPDSNVFGKIIFRDWDKILQKTNKT